MKVFNTFLCAFINVFIQNLNTHLLIGLFQLNSRNTGIFLGKSAIQLTIKWNYIQLVFILYKFVFFDPK